MFSRFLAIVFCQYFIPLLKTHTPFYISFLFLPFGEHVGCFRILTVLNNASITIHASASVHFSWEYISIYPFEELDCFVKQLYHILAKSSYSLSILIQGMTTLSVSEFILIMQGMNQVCISCNQLFWSARDWSLLGVAEWRGGRRRFGMSGAKSKK